MEPLGVALIGCGNMGQSLAQGAKKVERMELICTCDLDEEKGTALAEEVECDYVPELDDVLARKEVEAVVVATPPHFHEGPVVKAAEAGRHVFCEKPMAPTLDGCDRILAATRQADVVLAVGLVCRLMPVHKKIKELVQEGVVGDPICMTVHRTSGSLKGRWRASWREKQSESGGLLMETNAHEIDFLRYVMDDEVVEVYAAGGRYVNESQDYPDEALVTLRFKSGGIGHLHSSYASAISAYGGRLDGTGGSIGFPSVWGDSGPPIRYRTAEGEELSVTWEDLEGSEDGVEAELRIFAEAVQDGSPVCADGSDGRAATEIALAAYRSIETGKPVGLPLEG